MIEISQIFVIVYMSRLLVFGPSAFPVMVTRAGAVVVAGAYYGRGRVIVMAHENSTHLAADTKWCLFDNDVLIYKE